MTTCANTLWLSLALATGAIAADGETKKYPLPNNTTLELTVPAGWQDEAKAKEGNNPAAIYFTPKQGAPFKVFVIPVGTAKADTDTAIQMRIAVQQQADKVKPQAAEPILTAEEFKGAPGAGYFFSATDPAPKPNEFKFLSQGMLLVGEVVVGFGVLTNDGQESVKEQAFAMLKGAKHTK
jgi:hypothetical protein